MSASFWSLWNSAAKLGPTQFGLAKFGLAQFGLAQLGLPKPSVAELALLILLGASLLALRAFRETYLKVWILGWTALVASQLAEHCFAAKIPAPFDAIAVQATFVLAVGLLAGAVLLYTRIADLIVPLMVITPVLVGFAGVRILFWPDSLPLRVAVDAGNHRRGCSRSVCRDCNFPGRLLLTASQRRQYWHLKLRLA
jgi:hypothetical protein